MNNPAKILGRPLARGAHEDHSAMCVMEAVAYVAGEPWSDAPACSCRVISAFLRSWNDELDDADRETLLRPLIYPLIGTRGTPALEQRRSVMALDWLIRVHTPAWLRLAELDTRAATLVSLPEITNFVQCPALLPALNAAKVDADAAWAAAGAAAGAAAWAAARDAARDAARAAAWDAARAAALDAAGAAAWAAARAAARAAAGDAAGAAAWAAAMDAARDAAWAAALDALAPTTKSLQQSALSLIHRMIEAKEAV